MTTTTDILTVTVNGADFDLTNLADLRVRLSLLETSSLVMRFDDPQFGLLDGATFAIGAAVKVQLSSATVQTAVFDGEVVAIGLEQTGTGGIAVVEAMDKSHRLSATVKPSTYLNQSTSAIVSSIAGDHGLASEVTATDQIHEYLLKTTNDRRFLDELADDVGFEWFVQANKLIFRPRPEPTAPVVTLSWGGLPPLLRLDVRASGVDGAKSIEVHGWDDAASREIVGKYTASTAAEGLIGADSALATDTYRNGANTFGGTMVLAPGVVLDQSEAERRAKNIGADLQASTMRITGASEPNSAIMPGVWIALADCGAKLSGKYYVTDVEHAWGVQKSLETRFRLSGRRPVGLAGRAVASAPHTFGQVGFVVGVVTNVKDDEKRMHRVKVRFPTLPDVESAWARVVTLGGEAAAGVEARPEVDDEVLVGFEQGDPRRPFVIGALLSKTDAYRTGAINSDGSVNKRGIRTRAGNKLEMFDGDSKSASTGRYIALVGADAATELRLGDENMSLKTKNGNPITIQSGTAKITLDNGKVIINGDTIELKSTQGLKAQGMTVDLKSDTAMGLDAGSTFKAQGQASVAISASGIAEIKGSLLKLN